MGYKAKLLKAHNTKRNSEINIGAYLHFSLRVLHCSKNRLQ